MFRRGFRIWWFVGAMVCVAGAGGGIAYWVKSKPKTFLDYPTRELHATVTLRGLQYEEPVFLTASEIGELKHLVLHCEEWDRGTRPKSFAWALVNGPDASIVFYHHEKRINRLSLHFGALIFFEERKPDPWIRVNPEDYSEFQFHCHETYEKRHSKRL